MKVLVKEKIADAGVELLRESFEVDLGLDWDDGELDEADRRVRRDPDPLGDQGDPGADRARPTTSRSIGRAGTGVDNVDIAAATRRGILVANAPESNSVAAAEHTLALMLALCRNIPAADASLKAGEWERSEFKGTELYGKTLGVIGFGRIGQLVAKRAQAFEMNVVAFDKFVTRRALPRARRRGRWRTRTSCSRAPTSSPCTCRRPRRRSAWSTPRRSRR